MEVSFVRSDEKMPLVMKSSLSLISKSFSLRCDARQAMRRFIKFDEFMNSIEHFYLGDFLPHSFVKGGQPSYIESLELEGVPVINTLAIQNLSINVDSCRYITQEDYDALEAEKKPKKNDVLLTMDGGTSIGKPVFFDLEDDYAIDSHIAILRPVGLDPKVLVYLLASPFGQLQFQRAESGASGQTAVIEEDVRKFRFPAVDRHEMVQIVNDLDTRLNRLRRLTSALKERRDKAWENFNDEFVTRARQAGKIEGDQDILFEEPS